MCQCVLTSTLRFTVRVIGSSPPSIGVGQAEWVYAEYRPPPALVGDSGDANGDEEQMRAKLVKQLLASSDRDGDGIVVLCDCLM